MGEGGSLIEGKVHQADGRPVVEARVFIAFGPVPIPDIAQLTDDDGRFTLAAPTPGSYQIGCHADGLEPTQVTAEVHQDADRVQVDIQMTPETG